MVALHSLYYLPGKVISAVVGLVYIKLTWSPNMSFLARLVSNNSRSLEKFELEHRALSPRHPRKKLHGV